MQPNAAPPKLTTLDGRRADAAAVTPRPMPAAAADAAGAARGGGGGGGGFGGRGGGGAQPGDAPRVLLSFPTDPNDLLLSGLLVGGEALAGRAVAIDAPVGKGHVVMFANRPLLALADAGELLPRLQRDPELERSRRRPPGGDDHDRGRALKWQMTNGECRMPNENRNSSFDVRHSTLTVEDSRPVVGHVPDLEQRLAVHQARAA